jgi:hypothetical protein
MKFRTLKENEIEVRVQSVKNGKATMLLYIDSRCVTNLLDETVGCMNWQTEFYEVNGLLMGKLGIWCEEKKMWIWKSDTGTESNIEAEKGLVSDTYKRLLSRWGVTELYTAPRIQLEDDGYGNSGYRVNEIQYDNARNITHLVIINRFGKEAYRWDKYNVNTSNNNVNITPQVTPTQNTVASPPITTQSPQATTTSTTILTSPTTEEKQNMLANFCKEKQANGENRIELGKFYNYYNAKRFEGQMDVEKLWTKWKERSTARYAA